MFFSYDGQDFELHNTEQEARDAAEDALDFFRGEASDGWDDESMHVCWGRLMQSVQVTKERPAEPDDNMPEGIETYQRRELVDCNAAAAAAVLPYTGEAEHPDGYDRACGCDLCLSYA